MQVLPSSGALLCLPVVSSIVGKVAAALSGRLSGCRCDCCSCLGPGISFRRRVPQLYAAYHLNQVSKVSMKLLAAALGVAYRRPFRVPRAKQRQQQQQFLQTRSSCILRSTGALWSSPKARRCMMQWQRQAPLCRCCASTRAFPTHLAPAGESGTNNLEGIAAAQAAAHKYTKSNVDTICVNVTGG
jgi:hypothetical protein